MKINEKLMSITEEIGPDACEFTIDCKVLADLVKTFIEEYEDDFDKAEGRYLSVKGRQVNGIVAIGTTPIIKDDIVSCLEECFYELGIDEDYIDQLRDINQELLKDVEYVKWEMVTRDLSAMDFGANIDSIDDDLFRRLSEDNGFSGNRKEVMKDPDFRELVEGYLNDEFSSLLRIDCFILKDDTVKSSSEIKDSF